jgi:hypothetical protein
MSGFHEARREARIGRIFPVSAASNPFSTVDTLAQALFDDYT